MAALESGSKPEPRELGNVIVLTKCANALGCALIVPTTKRLIVPTWSPVDYFVLDVLATLLKLCCDSCHLCCNMHERFYVAGHYVCCVVLLTICACPQVPGEAVGDP